jgi:hypothetical protein
MTDVQRFTDEIRDIVEGIHGRPRGRRGVTVVVSNILCSDGGPCWVAKVKYGSMVIAKCGRSPCGHLSIESALSGLLAETRHVLGVRE